MTNRSRVAITLATTLVLGADAYGHAFDISLPGALQGIWDHSNWVIDGLAILSAFLVYRWWALLPAIAPAAVIVYLQIMTDYVEPWHGEVKRGQPAVPLPADYRVEIRDRRLAAA